MSASSREHTEQMPPLAPDSHLTLAPLTQHLGIAQRASDLAQRRKHHWFWNRCFVGVLLGLWFLVTFVVPYHARDLSFRFFGWPFGFWMAAQGALLVYLLLVLLYARMMDKLDRQDKLDEED